MLRYKIQADWHETGTPGGMTPQLQFYMPFGYVSEKTRYDVPGGAVERESAGHDVPAVYYEGAASGGGRKLPDAHVGQQIRLSDG